MCLQRHLVVTVALLPHQPWSSPPVPVGLADSAKHQAGQALRMGLG